MHEEGESARNGDAHPKLTMSIRYIHWRSFCYATSPNISPSVTARPFSLGAASPPRTRAFYTVSLKVKAISLTACARSCVKKGSRRWRELAEASLAQKAGGLA